MALSGTINGSVTQKSNYFSFYMTWTATQSVSGNYSDVTVKTYWKTSNTSQNFDTAGKRSASITINGTKTSISKVFAVYWSSVGNPYLIQTATQRVYHNSDGTKSITISARANGHAVSYGPSSSTASSADCTASGTITLNTIPRASVMDSVSCATSYFNGTITYKYTPQSASFYNRCNISLNLDGEFIKVKTINLGQKSASQQTGTVALSSSELATIYENLPKTTKGTLRFTLRTYSDSGYTTQIGDADYKEIESLIIPTTINPKLGTITVDPVNITTEDGTSRNILVKGKNKVKISISGSTAGDGSSIKSYTFDVLSGSTVIASTTTTSTSATLGSFSKTGTLKFRVTVADNRGRSTNNSGSELTCECYDYIEPTFKSFNIFRANSDGTANMNGTYIRCNYTQKYSSVGSTNNVNVIAYYNNKSQAGTGGVVNINLGGDVATTYKVYLVISDNYGGKYTTSTITVFGQSRILNITSDGTGVAIGKMAESKNLFECRWPSKFDDKVTVPDNGGPVLNGYSVGTLGVGKDIASNDDLNNYITPGVYRSTSASISETLSNTPFTAAGFKLKVEYIANSGYLIQTVIPRQVNCRYYKRYYQNETWYEWQTFAAKDTTNYLKLSGGTLTGKLTLDGNLYYASGNTAGLDCQNSDIINANAIYFKDATDTAGEGINFCNADGSTWDTLFTDDGVLRYHPSRGTSTTPNGYKIYHGGNLSFRRGTCTLSSYEDVTVTFSSAIGGTPTVMLTPLTSAVGAIPGKVKSVTSTGFTAIIGGDAVSSAKFAYLAIYY